MARFIGREAELKQLADWADEYAVISVVGPGGVGKTRFIHEFLKNNPGLFVDLSTAPDSDAATDLIHDRVGGGSRWLETIRRVPKMIVLDNAEHVLDAVYSAIDDIITTESTVVVTSREPIAHDAERVFSLSPFTIEETESLLRDIATRREILSEHELDELDFETVHERLDGLPLAVEIAAPRLAIVNREDRTSFLKKPVRGKHPNRQIPDRHRTLDDVFEWSWTGLTDDQKRVLSACSVFPEPFSRDAADFVTDAVNDIDGVLVELIEKSLLKREDTELGVRFRMLFTIRNAANQKMCDDERRRSGDRMANYYSTLTFATPRYDRWQLSEPWMPLRVARLADISDETKLRVFRALRTLWEATWRAGFEQWGETESFLGNRFRDNIDAILLRAEATARRREWDTFGELFKQAIEHDALENEMVLQLQVFCAWYGAEVTTDMMKELAARLEDPTRDQKLVFLLNESFAATILGDDEAAKQSLDDAEELLIEVSSPSAQLTVLSSRALHAWRYEALKEAAIYFQRASDLSAELSVAHKSTYVTVLRRLGRPDEALKIAKSTYEAATQSAAVIPLATLAWEIFLLTDSKEPLEQALELAEGSGVDSTLWFRLGLANASHQHTETAVRAFNRALETSINPGQSGVALAMLVIFERALMSDLEKKWGDTTWQNEVATVKQVLRTLDEPELRETLLASFTPDHRHERRVALEYEKMLAQVDLTEVWEFVVREMRHDRPTFVITRTGNLARLPNGDLLDLTRRGPMKRILVALVEARLEGRFAVPSWDIWEVGWPGESIDPKSATARIYTTINTMRKIGLRDIVCTDDEGYLINPELAVEIVNEL